MKKYIKYLIVPLIIFVLLRILFVTDFWVNIENKVRDTFFQMRGKRDISDKIVIVEIGDETLATLDARWPFPREYHARLIENLEKAEAKQIIYDIEFTESNNIFDDQKLVEVCKKYDNIILAGKYNKKDLSSSTREQFLPPLQPLLDTGVKWGMVNISADDDGFIRKYEIYQKRGKEIKLSLGTLSVKTFYAQKNRIIGANSEVKVLNDNKNFQIANNFIPKIDRKKCLINFYGPAKTFKTFDYSNVIDDSTFTTSFEKQIGAELNQFYLIKNEFKDKIVLIGHSTAEFSDTHCTPFFGTSRKFTSGVEIHANFIEMVLHKDYLREISYLLSMLIFLILCFLLFPANVRIRPTLSLFFGIIFSIFYLILSYQLFSKNSFFIPILEVPILLMVTYIIGLIFQYIKTARERRFIKNVFGKYIDPELVKELLKDPSKLKYGGSQEEISIMYVDVVSFTSYTESHTPKETVELLREYLTAMVDVITHNKGTIDKFVGDEIIALFGAPIRMENHAYWACKAALEMRERINELMKKWDDERKDPFDIGIGINSGIVTVGNLGSEQIFDYTAIGDNMNIGARIEALTRDYETKNNIIISEATFNLAKDRIISEYIIDAKVKGKAQTIKIYELLGRKKEISAK